jgi:hypothetical protein
MEQLQELFYAHPRVRDDAAKRSGSHLLVVGNNGAGIGLVTAKDHVASGLAAEHKARALQRGTHFTA